MMLSERYRRLFANQEVQGRKRREESRERATAQTRIFAQVMDGLTPAPPVMATLRDERAGSLTVKPTPAPVPAPPVDEVKPGLQSPRTLLSFAHLGPKMQGKKSEHGDLRRAAVATRATIAFRKADVPSDEPPSNPAQDSFSMPPSTSRRTSVRAQHSPGSVRRKAAPASSPRRRPEPPGESEVTLEGFQEAVSQLGYTLDDLLMPHRRDVGELGLSREQVSRRLAEARALARRRGREVRQRALDLTRSADSRRRQDSRRVSVDRRSSQGSQRVPVDRRPGLEEVAREQREQEAAWLAVVVRGRLMAAQDSAATAAALAKSEQKRLDHVARRATSETRRRHRAGDHRRLRSPPSPRGAPRPRTARTQSPSQGGADGATALRRAGRPVDVEATVSHRAVDHTERARTEVARSDARPDSAADGDAWRIALDAAVARRTALLAKRSAAARERMVYAVAAGARASTKRENDNADRAVLLRVSCDDALAAAAEARALCPDKPFLPPSAEEGTVADEDAMP